MLERTNQLRALRRNGSSRREDLTLAGLKPSRRLFPTKDAGQSQEPLSADAQRLIAQRFALLERFKELVAGGHTRQQAARAIGTGYVTIWRWLKRLEAHGLTGLALQQPGRCGRKPAFDPALITPRMLSIISSLALATGSVHHGFKLFAETRFCHPRLARIIRKAKTIPPSLRKLVSLRPVKLKGVRAGGQLWITKGAS